MASAARSRLLTLSAISVILTLIFLNSGRGEGPAADEKPADRLASNADVAHRSPTSKAIHDTAGKDPIAAAKAAMAECKATFGKVEDYSFVFYKRERVDGQMTPLHVIHMKIRNKPLSVYAKFSKPKTGREAIYVTGRHGGKAVVHDIGLGKLLAGTMKLDPLGSTAMEDNRHPITEAGIGHMIDTIIAAWNKELSASESQMTFHRQASVGDRSCFMIESVHPRRRSDFMFHKVKVYIDRELNLPIRFEAYDWPKNGHPEELVEEYTYTNLKLNVGLKDADFDPNNTNYSFGRF